MKSFSIGFFFLFLLFFLNGCKQNNRIAISEKKQPQNEIQFAKGFEMYRFEGFTVVKVTQPWPNAKKTFVTILKEKNGIIPDSLQSFPVVNVPIQTIVTTSTTHIPALELLGVENTLVGFPNTDFISSTKTRKRIDAGKIREVGNNETLHTEVVIDLAPDLIMGFGLNDNNPSIDNLEKSGLKVIFNGDWNENSPLGKAEWIKVFGALYNKQNEATRIFNSIQKEYQNTLKLVQNTQRKPTVMCGAMFQDQWFVPQGESWAALFLAQAQTNYLWSDTKGTGSLSLPFETVLDKAQNAEFWIAPGDFVSLESMKNSNPHYAEFESFKNKKVYSYALHKGKTGGILYFEWSPARPDWVLKDLIAIFHPELLPNHNPYFFEKLN